VAYSYDQNDQPFFLDLIDNAILANAPVNVLLTRKLLDPLGARIIG
jgi:hypothetical protein